MKAVILLAPLMLVGLCVSFPMAGDQQQHLQHGSVYYQTETVSGNNPDDPGDIDTDSANEGYDWNQYLHHWRSAGGGASGSDSSSSSSDSSSASSSSEEDEDRYGQGFITWLRSQIKQ